MTTQIWSEIAGQRYGHFPVSRLADYVVALLREHLHQIKTDEHLILGDDNPCLGRVSDLAVLSSHGDTLTRCLLQAWCIDRLGNLRLWQNDRARRLAPPAG